MKKSHVSIEQYLLSEMADGKTEFRISARLSDDAGGVKIYIHPLGKDGESRDFLVTVNQLQDVTRWLPEP